MGLFIPPENYKTERVWIRTYYPDDGPTQHEAIMSSIEHLRPWFPWATPERTLEDSVRYVRQSRGRWLLGQDFSLGIFTPDGSRQLGGTGFHVRGTLEDTTAEIGMWIRVDEAGKGLGTHVLQSLLAWGFEEWPWLRLFWRCDSRNIPSARTAEKAGLRREAHFVRDEVATDGIRRDTYLYAILRDEWLTR